MIALVWTAAFLACGAGLAEARQPARSDPEPVNASATPEARALLRYLYSISGRYTLSGQHNYPYTIARWTDRAYDFTGRYPALFGQDFGFTGGQDKDSIEARPALVAEMIRQHGKGALVTLTWHAVRPTDDEPVTFHDSVQGRLSDFEWRELLTPGTSLHTRWCEQVDVIAGYLRELQRARVPVLWRPYHEVNGHWFWWGGRPGRDGSAALYRQLYDRLTRHHRLDNLVWVWNANAPREGPNGAGPFADYFPGLEYADVLSVDNYGPFAKSHYDDVLALAAGKPIALGEVGAAPTPSVLREQPRWTWFMVWSEILELANPEESLRELFAAPNVANRDDPRLARPMAAIRGGADLADADPVTPDATPEARRVLARLREAGGRQQTLAGQDGDPRATGAEVSRLTEATGRRPAVFGQELAIPTGLPPAAARLRIAEEAERQHRDGAIVTLSWQPARPTDDEIGVLDDASLGALTDFEWNELLTPGARLEERWRRQTDAMADSLRRLQEAGVPVLFRPYPRPNAKGRWWSDRKGSRGSAALYRRLFERLVGHHGLRHLVWIWSAAAPGRGPDGGGPYGDFFPGLGYVDALAVELDDESPPWGLDARLALFGVGKPIGLRLGAAIPAPDVFSRQRWAWFLLGPQATPPPERDEALRVLYEDPHVVSRPVASAPGSQDR